MVDLCRSSALPAVLMEKLLALPDDVTAPYILNLWTVERQLQIWREELPFVKPHYAVKANNTAEIISALLQAGVAVDCASPAEIETVLSLGARPEDIVYSHTHKHVKGLELAREVGVNLTTADSLSELLKIYNHHPTCEVLLRITVKDADAQCPMSHKFGCSRNVWSSLLRTAQELGVQLVGVHFHVGSGCTNLSAYREGIEDAAALFNLAADFGFNFRVLDIGGGYPGEFRSQAFRDIAAVVRDAIKSQPCFDEARVIAEPGRYFCCACQVVAARVIGVKGLEYALPRFSPKPNEPYPSLTATELDELKSSGRTVQYFVNATVYGLFSNVIYDHATPKILWHKQQQSEGPLLPATLFGQSCDGIDVIRDNLRMPLLQVGDWVVVPDSGAYTQVSASTFNGFAVREACVVSIPLQ